MLNWFAPLRRMARMVLALALLVCLSAPGLAGAIEKGEKRQVEPNSIWFLEAATLTQWQALKSQDDGPRLASYQETVLAQREAWQFTEALTVEVLGFDPLSNQVHVKLRSPGRLSGSTWLLDARALRD